MARPGRFRGYPGRLHGNLALLLGEEEAELHDAALGGTHRAVMTGPSWKRPPVRWSNPALSLPSEWSRPRISIDYGFWTQGPKSPLHQLSRHYRSCHIILMFDMSFRDSFRDGVKVIVYRALKRLIFLKTLASSGAIGSLGNAFWALAT